ncbi:hypothetical protein E2562_020859 [Oryza meyeriana var. granulata]|uniref:Uncharacterized protein n=1 Tax=Oryza meyeriana var. granulata TaxID=110450 RepID=A0A6G1D610_9ORYZ|nr:hypothetical protein E2562_020859 [Oryza meyeriana var. granulata]
MSRGPMYPDVPSSPTAGTAMSVWYPGPSSFSITTFTTVYPGVWPRPRRSCSRVSQSYTMGIPSVDGADDEVSLVNPPPLPPCTAEAAPALESESPSSPGPPKTPRVQGPPDLPTHA